MRAQAVGLFVLTFASFRLGGEERGESRGESGPVGASWGQLGESSFFPEYRSVKSVKSLQSRTLLVAELLWVDRQPSLIYRNSLVTPEVL